MFVEQDGMTDVNFSTRHIGECYISEDKRGRVDTVYRVFNMPGHALRDRFGVDKLSKKLQDRIDEYHDAVELVHAVYPRDNYDVTMATKENKPFASVYYEPTETVVLSEGGFDELPLCCATLSKEQHRDLWTITQHDRIARYQDA